MILTVLGVLKVMTAMPLRVLWGTEGLQEITIRQYTAPVLWATLWYLAGTWFACGQLGTYRRRLGCVL